MTGKSKITRVIISSTHVDSQRDRMSIETLNDYVKAINNPDTKIRMSVEHRLDFPPKGIINNAILKQKGDYYYVEADFCEFEESCTAEWDNTLVIESFSTSFSFADVKSKPVSAVSISIDPNNFRTDEDYARYIKTIREVSEDDLEIVEPFRKSADSIPEIIITLTPYLLTYPLIKKVGDKITDEVSAQIVAKGKKVFKIIEIALKEGFYRLIPSDRPVITIFEYPGKPHIQFVARTRNQQLILEALKKIPQAMEQIEEYKKLVPIAQIQFVLSSKGKWKFNYLLTTDGKSIGKKKTVSNRDKKIEHIKLSAQKADRPIGLSVGGVVKERSKIQKNK